jgi:hypothetical protein
MRMFTQKLCTIRSLVGTLNKQEADQSQGHMHSFEENRCQNHDLVGNSTDLIYHPGGSNILMSLPRFHFQDRKNHLSTNIACNPSTKSAVPR